MSAPFIRATPARSKPVSGSRRCLGGATRPPACGSSRPWSDPWWERCFGCQWGPPTRSACTTGSVHGRRWHEPHGAGTSEAASRLGIGTHGGEHLPMRGPANARWSGPIHSAQAATGELGWAAVSPASWKCGPSISTPGFHAQIPALWPLKPGDASFSFLGWLWRFCESGPKAHQLPS
jgi:hypothetical protein